MKSGKRRKTTLAPEHVQLYVNDILEIAPQLVEAERELRHRSYDPGAGFSGSSIGGGGGGGPVIRVTHDDDPEIAVGDVETYSVTTVEAQVFQKERPDPVKLAHEELLQCLTEARERIVRANNRYLAVTEMLDRVVEPENDDDIYCSHHLKFGYIMPRGNPKWVGKDSTLCGWCFAFYKDKGWMPQKSLFELIDRNKKVTVDEVARARRQELEAIREAKKKREEAAK